MRKFGLRPGAVLAALGGSVGPRQSSFSLAPGSGIVLLAGGVALPKAPKPVYLAWMALALALGFVVSHVVLTLFFFLAITWFWLRHGSWASFLRLKLDPHAPTYRLPRERHKPNAPSQYERQY